MTPMNIGMPILRDESGKLLFCDQPLPDGYAEFVLKVYGAIAFIVLLAIAAVLLAGIHS